MSDLKTMLCDKAKASPNTAASIVEVASRETNCQTVLELDRWGMRRGEELADSWRGDHGEIDPNLAADANGALFEPYPKMATSPADEQRAAWFRQFMDSAEYHALHNQTMLDPELAAMAAWQVVNEFRNYADQNPPAKPGDPQPGSDEESVGSQMARLRSTAKATKNATQEIADAQDAAAGLGLGGEGQPIDHQALADAFKRVRNSSMLRKVLELAGRMRARCRTLQRQKLAAKRGEITGVELGGDISRLIPRERLALAGGMGSDLQERAEYRLLKRRSLCYRQKLKTPMQSGPIVVSVDESESMSGEKIIAAKALALTMAWLAGQQNRWFALVGFSGASNENAIAFAPGQTNPDALIGWVEHFFQAGTHARVPFQRVPNDLWAQWSKAGMKRGAVDHIVITDGEITGTPKIQSEYKAWAASEKVTTYGVAIGVRSLGFLEGVADRAWMVDAINLGNDAVEELLAI